MTIIKEYYRLSEIERYFGISEEDVTYLAENDKIRLSLFCNNVTFITGQWIENKDNKTKFCGNSVVNYQGAIELPPTEYQELKNSDKLSSLYAILQQKERVQHVSQKYPFQIKTPNWLIEEWNPQQLELTSKNYILAMFLPYERENIEKQAADFFGVFIGNKTVAEIKKSMQQKEMVLRHNEHGFLVDDIRILHETALKAVQFLTGKVKEPAHQTTSMSKINNQYSKKERNSDLHDLLKRVIIEKPSYSAKQIWTAIELDFTIDEGEREFDQYNILRDVSASELLWESRYGNGGTFKFSSLGTTVSKIRKKINTN